MKKIVFISIILLFILIPISFNVDIGSNSISIVFSKALAASSCTTESSSLYCAIVTGLEWALSGLAIIPIAITSFFVYVFGGLLDFVIKDLVVNFSIFFSAADSGITKSWETLRDLSNIFFIFGLLTIAISTIIGLQGYGYKKLLVRLIIVALLINFSLFFTKFVIDTSNVFTLQFYNGITGGSSDVAISSIFMERLGIGSAWDTISVLESLTNIASREGGISLLFTYAMFVSIFFSITAFVFLFTAIMLIIRAVGFILLAILSPIAFAAIILPKTQRLAEEWWGKLWQYAIFAPILFVLFWITLTIIPSITSSLQNGGAGILGAFSGDVEERAGSIAVIVNFMIIITFMVSSIIISNKLSIAGSKSLTKMGSNLGKFGSRTALRLPFGLTAALARGTIGRGAAAAAKSKFAGRMEMLSPKIGGAMVRGLKDTAKSSFDIRQPLGKINKDVAQYVGIPQKGGYEGDVKKISERRKQTGEHIVEVLGKGKSEEEKTNLREMYAKKLEQGFVSDVNDIVAGAKDASIAAAAKVAKAKSAIVDTVDKVKKDGAKETAKRAMRATRATLIKTPGFVYNQVISPNIYDANKKAAENMRKISKAAEVKEGLKKIDKEMRDALDGIKSKIDVAETELNRSRRELGTITQVDPDRENKIKTSELRIQSAENDMLKLKKEMQEERGKFEDRKRELQEKNRDFEKKELKENIDKDSKKEE